MAPKRRRDGASATSAASAASTSCHELCRTLVDGQNYRRALAASNCFPVDLSKPVDDCTNYTATQFGADVLEADANMTSVNIVTRLLLGYFQTHPIPNEAAVQPNVIAALTHVASVNKFLKAATRLPEMHQMAIGIARLPFLLKTYFKDYPPTTADGIPQAASDALRFILSERAHLGAVLDFPEVKQMALVRASLARLPKDVQNYLTVHPPVDEHAVPASARAALQAIAAADPQLRGVVGLPEVMHMAEQICRFERVARRVADRVAHGTFGNVYPQPNMQEQRFATIGNMECKVIWQLLQVQHGTALQATLSIGCFFPSGGAGPIRIGRNIMVRRSTVVQLAPAVYTHVFDALVGTFNKLAAHAIAQQAQADSPTPTISWMAL